MVNTLCYVFYSIDHGIIQPEGGPTMGLKGDSLNKMYHQSFEFISSLIVVLAGFSKYKQLANWGETNKEYLSPKEITIRSFACPEIQDSLRKWSMHSFGIINIAETYLLREDSCSSSEINIFGIFLSIGSILVKLQTQFKPKAFERWSWSSEVHSSDMNGEKTKTWVSLIRDETGLRARESFLMQLAQSAQFAYTANTFQRMKKSNKNWKAG